MKTLIVIFLLTIYSNLFSQNPGWNDLDTTDIPNRNYAGNHNERIALFANHYGIHVLSTQYTSDSMHVKYYRLKTSGDLDSGFTYAGTDLDDYGDFPNIVGDEISLYAVYRKNDTIKVKYSNDGGDTWGSSPVINFFYGNVTCNGVDAAYNSTKGLHVVWSEEVAVGKVSHYESFFNRLTGFGWDGSSNITDHAILDSAGSFPTITTSIVSSTPRAHITINTGNADLLGNNFGKSYSRDFDYDNPWSAPVVIDSSDSSKMERLLVTEDDTIHCFYYKGTGIAGFKYRRKAVTSSTWGSEIIIDASVAITDNIHNIPITMTSGDTLHAFFFESGLGFKHRKKYSTASSWSGLTDVSGGGVSWQDAAVTSASNDLFTLFVNGTGSGSQTNYKYRQYDDIPSPPQNLTVDKSAGNHPELEWNENYEPDLDEYYIYRLDSYGGGWQYLANTATTVYEDTTFEYCNAIPPAECENARNFYYRITAVDLQSHESEPSDSVEAYLVGGAPDKKSADNNHITPLEYSLQQNYPNPFNPVTRIDYSIKINGAVTLLVYDILGREVATLVNENKPAGNYSVEFSTIGGAANLPSGIYVYRLTSGKFTDTKKLILLK